MREGHIHTWVRQLPYVVMLQYCGYFFPNDTVEDTLMVQGLEARGSTRHLNIPHETRLDLVKITYTNEVS